MTSLQELTDLVNKFSTKRDWEQFHTPRNLAESLVLEVAEVLEHFQWKTEAEFKQHLETNKQEFAYELADVLNYLLLLADVTNIDLAQALESNLKLAAKRYPVSESKGKGHK